MRASSRANNHSCSEMRFSRLRSVSRTSCKLRNPDWEDSLRLREWVSALAADLFGVVYREAKGQDDFFSGGLGGFEDGRRQR